MAMSNWDTMAFGPDGAAHPREFEFDKTTVAIYKNWVYLYNPELWKDGYQFSKPCIAEIQSGDVQMAGVNIMAHRHGKQGAVFLLAARGYGADERNFSGIGCYGYIDSLEAVKQYYPDEYAKIPLELLNLENFDISHYSNSEPDPNDPDGYIETWGLVFSPTDESAEMVRWPIEGPQVTNEYVGVLPETFEAFKAWLKTQKPEYAATIQPGVRYNQGDEFLATNAGVPFAATVPGSAQPPVLESLLQATLNAADKT